MTAGGEADHRTGRGAPANGVMRLEQGVQSGRETWSVYQKIGLVHGLIGTRQLAAES